MKKYCYVKKKENPYKKAINMGAYILIIVGSLFLFWSFYPIVSYEIYAHLFLQREMTSPVFQADASQSYTRVRSTLGSSDVLSTNLSDYTKASSWFPDADDRKLHIPELNITNYLLSIPILGIDNAAVLVGGEDLTDGLVQYRPETLPGQLGKSFVFGHSIHPAMYSPKNYRGIFTYLPTLSIGDKIIATVNGVEYEYEVFDKYEVKPDQVSVLAQQFDDSYLVLITCTPPGSVQRRAVILSRLVQL